jgi:hypothetical protein
MEKQEEILLYSNPYKVYHNAVKFFGNNVEIRLSTRKNKKYMIKNPYTNKWVHFGKMPYEDFTKHNDKERQKRFKIRNYKWRDKINYSPAFLSYHLLW